jgi:hypothetical protein
VEVAAEGEFLHSEESSAYPTPAHLLREERSIGVAMGDLPDPSPGDLVEPRKSEEAADDDLQNRGIFSAIYNFFNTSRKVIFSEFYNDKQICKQAEL